MNPSDDRKLLQKVVGWLQKESRVKSCMFSEWYLSLNRSVEMFCSCLFCRTCFNSKSLWTHRVSLNVYNPNPFKECHPFSKSKFIKKLKITYTYLDRNKVFPQLIRSPSLFPIPRQHPSKLPTLQPQRRSLAILRRQRFHRWVLVRLHQRFWKHQGVSRVYHRVVVPGQESRSWIRWWYSLTSWLVANVLRIICWYNSIVLWLLNMINGYTVFTIHHWL